MLGYVVINWFSIKICSRLLLPSTNTTGKARLTETVPDSGKTCQHKLTDVKMSAAISQVLVLCILSRVVTVYACFNNIHVYSFICHQCEHRFSCCIFSDVEFWCHFEHDAYLPYCRPLYSADWRGTWTCSDVMLCYAVWSRNDPALTEHPPQRHWKLAHSVLSVSRLADTAYPGRSDCGPRTARCPPDEWSQAQSHRRRMKFKIIAMLHIIVEVFVSGK